MDRHYYLYAKNWYKKADLKEDLLKIHSEWSWTPVEFLHINDVVTMLLMIVEKHIKKGRFSNFVNSIRENHKGDLPWIESGQDLDTATINACLSILRFAPVDEIPYSLGFPDYMVLPYITGRGVTLWPVCFGI